MAFFLAILLSLRAHAEFPNLSGAVTAATSRTDFEVNGIHVVCDAHTKFELLRPSDAGLVSWSEKPYIGEPLLVFGHDHQHVIHASRVVFASREGRVRGQGIVLRVVGRQPDGSLLIRADGYPILCTASTQIAFVDPLKTLADVTANVWIEYQGNQRADGTIVAEKATLGPNVIGDREEKLRAKTSLDPSAPPPPPPDKDLEHGIQSLFSGKDLSRIPPSHDTVMQARVDAIGARLVPEYQRALLASDPSKIHFRFQVVDKKYASNRIDLPDGTILVPLETVARLENDDQIAAYLADGMGAILEKQRLRDAAKKLLLTAGEIGGMNWLAPGFLAAEKKDDLVRAESEQRIRVSLELLHDASYDLFAVPKTWWLLASKKPKPLSDIEMPNESIYAYILMGSIWRYANTQ